MSCDFVKENRVKIDAKGNRTVSPYNGEDFDQYIVITLKNEIKDKDVLVVNRADKAKTDALFQQITEHLNQKSE